MEISQSLNKLRSRYSQHNPQALRNPWVLGWLAIIVLFVIVNGIFFIAAVVSSPGLVVEDYYEQGRQYEKNALKLLAAHESLDWAINFEVPNSVMVNQPGVYRFSATDKRGIPIKRANINLEAYRPSNARNDFVTALEEVAPGLYQAAMALPLPGIWDLNLKIDYHDQQFQMTRRVSVQIVQ